MRAVKGEITSSRPIYGLKAAAVFSRFAASETGARQDVAAYLKRAASVFDELLASHREIRALQKMSHLEENEDEDDSSRKKGRRRKKGADYGADEVWEKQRFTDPMAESNGVVEVKKVKGEEEFSTGTEFNGVVKQKKEKKDKKIELKEKNNKVEAKGEEFERDWKGSEERRRKKEKKSKDDREEEAAKGSFEVKNTVKERKERKHLNTEQERVNGEMDQAYGKRKKKKRKVD